MAIQSSPSSFHLAPKQQGIFSGFLLLIVFCLHANVLDLLENKVQKVEMWQHAGAYFWPLFERSDNPESNIFKPKRFGKSAELQGY